MKKRLIAISLALIMLLGDSFAVLASNTTTENVNSEAEVTNTTDDIVDSGTCGTSATWELDSEYTITISGSGTMTNYKELANGSFEKVPWISYSSLIKKVIIASGITSVGSGSFANCWKIEEVELGDTVKQIGTKSFYNCEKLETIEFPESISYIGTSAFSGCEKLWYVNIPDTKITIGSKAFEFCYALKNIYIPKGKIEYEAFKHCKVLDTVIIGSEVTEIGTGAFSNCNALGIIELDEENINFLIEDGILFDITKTRLIKCPILNPINSYVVPDTVEKIDPYAFESCESLESMKMSDSVTSVGDGAFSYCTNLKTLVLSDNIKYINDGIAYKCSKLTDVNIPENVIEIQYDAFNGCLLKEIELPSKLEDIWQGAFWGCQFETITIPANVEHIGNTVFDCKNTNTIYFRGNAPSLSGSAFSDNSHQGTREIYYPENDDTWTDEVKQLIKGNNVWLTYKPQLTSVDTWTIEISNNSDLVYDTKEHRPKVIVKSGTSVLQEKTHYTVEYIDNILPGTASIIITGCGEYEGTITKYFTIEKGILKATVRSYSGTYDGDSHSFINPVISSVAATEYQTYYSTSEPLTITNFVALGSLTKPTRTNPGTTQVYYYIVDKDNYCEPITGSTFIAIKPKCSASDYTGIYDGDAHSPIITCSEGATLYYSTSRELNFSNYSSEGTTVLPERTKSGTTTVYYIAIPNNNSAENSVTTGSVQIVIEGESESNQIDISECSINVETNLIYTGTALEPNITIQYQGATLVKGEDYIVQYKNNIAVGTGSVVITGIGKYTGTVAKDFVIKEQEKPVKKEISDCHIVLSKSSFIYNGKVQIPEVTVKDGNQLLKQNENYKTSSEVGINAGTYVITITGTGDYSGSKTLTYEILPANPTLKFETAEVTKTIEDTSFINNLDVVTDGSLTYSSDNTSVATVNSYTGLVKIVGPGATVIRVKANAGKNYLAGSASYTLTVNEKEEELIPDLTLDNLSYSFGNIASSFNYPDRYNYPLSIYEMIFGKTTKAAFWYDRDYDITGGVWRGNCAGFSGTSALMADPDSDISIKDFDASVKTIGQLNAKSKSAYHGMNITQFIEAMQIAQHTQLFTNEITKNRVYTSKHINKKVKNLNALYETVHDETEAGRPVVLALYQSGAHAVLAYEVKDISDTESQIYLYDSNWPSEERILTLEKNSEGDFMKWSYEIGGSYGVWGTDSKSSSISYVPYSVIKEIWQTKGRLEENENVLSINSGSVAIYTSGDKPVATVTQGELSTTVDEIQVIDYLSLERADSDTLLLSVPVDVYTFQNLDKSVEEFEVSMTNTNLGAKASTTADSVTMAVDDSCNLNAVYIDAEGNDTYSITLNSSFSYDEDNVVVTGKGSGETMEVSQTKGSININNCQITSISVDGKEIYKYQITASAGTGGTISPAGETVVTKGETVSYKITPKSGYRISSVTVDGKSVGAISTYKFEDISDNHEIKAIFKKKSSNTISAKNFVKTYSTKTQSFYIKPTVKDKAKLSYSSNNKSVKVSSSGKVTIAKKFVGKATITIKSAETGTYLSTKKTITITVNPKGTSLSSLKKAGSGKMKVSWKKNSAVTGYQINYSTSSSFKSAKTVTIKKNSTTKTTIKKLKKNKKYYVRIRTYKTVSGKKYYSSWSGKKSLKVK